MSEVERLPTRADVQNLQEALVKLPQVELPTQHFFADGMYLRYLPRPKGCAIVGKVHKKEHFYMVLSGEILIVGDGKRERVKAPAIFVCKPGTKRAVYAIEDSVCATVHRVSSHDLAEIEEELVEYDPQALFGPGNVPKSLEAQECHSLQPPP
jgi:mannose-6-phosphate isomerase-like protein (cupin superfamily)